MQTPDPESLIGPYLAGELDATTAQEVAEYLGANPSRRGFVAGIRASVRGDGDPANAVLDDARVAAARARFLDKVGQLHGTKGEIGVVPVERGKAPLRSSAPARSGPRPVMPWMMGAGIALVAVAAIGGGIRQFFPSQRVVEQGRSYHTATGERLTVALANGSRIQLAPQSTLTVDATSLGTHFVLTGEAYFEIIRAGNEPVTVRAGRVTTSVFGTSFDVRHYEDDRRTDVAVMSGKVMVRAPHGVVTVAAGQAARVTDSSIATTVSDTGRVPNWTRGRLVFDDTPVSELLTTVGRWYGYAFRIAPSDSAALTSQDVSTVLDFGTPSETMTAIRELLGVTMTFDGRTVTLHRIDTKMSTPHESRAAFSPKSEAGR